jgi:hypothetical protein
MAALAVMILPPLPATVLAARLKKLKAYWWIRISKGKHIARVIYPRVIRQEVDTVDGSGCLMQFTEEISGVKLVNVSSKGRANKRYKEDSG